MERMNRILSFELGKCKVREPFAETNDELIYERLCCIQKEALGYITFFELNLDSITTDIDTKIKVMDSISLIKGSLGNIFNFFIESDSFKLVDYEFRFEKKSEARVFIYKQILNCDQRTLKDSLQWHEKLTGVRCLFLHTQLIYALNQVREIINPNY